MRSFLLPARHSTCQATRLLATRLSAFAAATLLVSCGCSQKAVPIARPVGPFLTLRSPDDSVQAVQRTAEYRLAVRSFARRDYRQALSLVDRLLEKPQFQQASAGFSFLRTQQAICRHALSPSALNPQANPENPQTYPALSPVFEPSPTVRSSPAVSAPRAAASRPAVFADCGPRALLLLCPRLGVHTTLDALRRQAGTTAAGTSLAGLARAAQAAGLKARGVRVDKQDLTQLSGPAVAWVDGDHYVALLSVEGQQATVHDPNQPEEEVLPVTRLLQRSGGVLLTLSR